MTFCALALLLLTSPGEPAARLARITTSGEVVARPDADDALRRPWDPKPRRRRAEPALAEPTPPPPIAAYYGYQTLILHTVSGAAVTAGALLHQDNRPVGGTLIGLGVLGTSVGPALIHAIHGEEQNALVSLTLNMPAVVGATIPGGLVGYAIGDEGYAGTFWGGIAASSAVKLLAIVLDATWLGYADASDGGALTWSPALTYTREGERWASVTVGF